MIRTILFDLDDTLLDFQRAEAEALAKALKMMGLEPTDEVIARYSVINQLMWQKLENKELTRPQVLVRRFEKLFEEFHMTADAEKTQHLYHSLLAEGGYYLPGAEELLKTLCAKYDLYAVSNGTAAVQDPRIAKTGIDRYFKGIFISERVGVDKPDVRFFDHCFARIAHFDKATAVIIGDSLTSDIRGGNNAGIRTVWFNPHHAARKPGIQVDYEVDALESIPALMAEM